MSKRSHEDYDDQQRVRAHYNALDVHKPASRQERSALPTATVRSLHNWLKEQQYQLHVSHGDVLLELCGGKGGDLPKVARTSARALVSIDLSEASVAEARRRCSQLPRASSLRDHCVFLVGDVLSRDFWASRAVERAFVSSVRARGARFQGVPRFQVVACQFALHYAFCSRESAELLFAAVASRLANNGVFFGIVANGDVIAAKLHAATAPTFVVDETLYRIDLRPSTVPGDGSSSSYVADETAINCDFGGRYYFTLHDGAVVDVPEYVTRESVVRACADAAELECVYYTPLDQLYTGLCRERPRECAESLERRGLGRIDDASWDVARLYSAFAFRRRARKRK